MIVIIKAMLVLIILVAMVMILMGINHLFADNTMAEEEEVAKLRTAVEEKEDVITPQNIFRRFLGR